MAYYNVQVQQFDVPALAYLYDIAAAMGVPFWWSTSLWSVQFWYNVYIDTS